MKFAFVKSESQMTVKLSYYPGGGRMECEIAPDSRVGIWTVFNAARLRKYSRPGCGDG